MPVPFVTLILCTLMSTFTLFDFDKKSDISNWYIVDDVVMGGRSNGDFTLSKDGHGVFEGKVSTENNGGFSSLRYRMSPTEVSDYKKVVIRLKGDGKRYQFRVKTHARDAHSYISHFPTSGDWETIELPFKDLYPSFRGRTLDRPNFEGEQMEELGFLIGNKKNEAFRLEIDSITLK